MQNPGSGPEASKSMQRLLPRRPWGIAGHKMVAWVIGFYMNLLGQIGRGM